MKKRKRTIILACVFCTLTVCAYALDEESEFLRMCQYGTQEQQRTIKAIAKKLKVTYEPANFPGIYKYIKEAKYFVLSDNLGIKDLTPFKYMKKASLLRIIDNEIKDLAPLKVLKTITDLEVSGNHISDLGPLTSLENLREIDIGLNRKIWDLRPLTKLAKLEVLRAGHNSIEDMNPIVNLSKLESLGLAYNKIKDICALRKLALSHKRGLYLNLSNNQITDISPLIALADNLEELRLTRNQITDIRPLAKLKRLKELNIAINNIRDISPLAGLTQLEKLTLYDNPITDLSPLKHLTKLKELDTSGLKLMPNTPQNLEELKLLMEKERQTRPIKK